MGKREKLIEQLTNSSHNSTFVNIRKLLEYEGFYLDCVTDSHHIFKYADTTFVIPVHNNRVVRSIGFVELLLEYLNINYCETRRHR